jgi:molecular chaperone GrpE (heat shock protein)
MSAASPDRVDHPDPGDQLRVLADSIARLEERQAGLERRVEEAVAAIKESGATAARALGAMQRDLVGERRGLATRVVFEAVVAALDSLAAMRDGLDGERDGRMLTQIRAVHGTLTNVLQALGFSRFEAEVGEPFDPARMEPLGYAEGARGVVLAAVRPGYLAENAVVRAAGVLIADPAGPSDGSGAGRET